ncbi:hypothetical protein H8E88_00145 [candidate division KSB1 bacterium]|nr:hypothetical protein [candidate division KSB1 bacterium]
MSGFFHLMIDCFVYPEHPVHPVYDIEMEAMNTSFLEKRAPSTWLALILIALAAAIIYSNIYNSPFVFDEIARIAENSTIEDLANYLSFEQLLKPRAVVDFTFALNYKFGKLNVFGYHLINVLIHVSNGFLVYLLSQRPIAPICLSLFEPAILIMF